MKTKQKKTEKLLKAQQTFYDDTSNINIYTFCF